MKNVLLYEKTRFWRSTKNIVVLLGYVGLLVGIIIYNTILDNNYWRNQKDFYGYERNAINNVISEVESQAEIAKEREPDDTETHKEFERQYDFYRWQYLYSYQQMCMARFHHREEAIERLQLTVERDKHMLQGLEQGYELLDHTPEEVKQRIAINEFILENGLTPLNSPHEMKATNFLTQLINYPWILAILIALALLSIDIFSGDVEGGAYKNLYSQPIARGKIYAAKYLIRFFYSFVVIIGVTALVFGLIALFNGLGALNYPIPYNEASFQSFETTGTHSFLPWSQYILKAIPLFCLLSLFTMLLIGTASLLLKNTGNALNASFCILVLDFLARTLFPVESVFYMFWPLTTASINDVLQGAYKFSALSYLLLLGLSVLILYLGGGLILRKQDLTGGAES
ncbi:MAG: ABC transporter permease subunit [Bacillota bacterium]|jgi:ABC-type transport system involved in multi-copper enzyme maturation permease subunit